MEICSSWQFWPITLCTYGVVATGLYGATLLANSGFLIYRHIRKHRYQVLRENWRQGALTNSFAYVFLATSGLVGMPWIYYFGHSTVRYNLVFFAWAIAQSLYWSIALYYLIDTWHDHRPALRVKLLYLINLLLILPVLFSWENFFPSQPFLITYFPFCLVNVLFTFTCAICVFSGWTLRDSSARYSGRVRTENNFRQVGSYIWPREEGHLQLRVVFCIGLLIIGRITNVIFPMYTKWILDELAAGHFCVKLILMSVLVKCLQGSAMGGFSNTIRQYLWVRVSQHTTKKIQVDMFVHLHKLSLRWHLSRKTGEVIRIMDRGTRSIQTLLSYIVFSVGPTIADIVIATFFFFIAYNWMFGLLVLITMSIYLTVTIAVTEWRDQYKRDMNAAENAWQFTGVDSLLNYETVKYYCAEDMEKERYMKACDKYQAAEKENMMSLCLLNLLQNTIIVVSSVMGSLMMAYFISEEKSIYTAGDYIMFTTYMMQLYTPLNFFGTLYRTVQNAFVDMESMFAFLDEKIEIVNPPNAKILESRAERLCLEHVVFGYKEGYSILNELSIEANAGETVAVVGASGSGKSTLIRLLFRLYDIQHGSITFGNHEIRTLDVHSLRSNIGIVPQDTVLFNESIEYNIRYGRQNATKDEIYEAAKTAEIHDFILTLPEGYETLVGERGLRLSGGEKQRVAIARTILKNPAFLLFDEATSALDSHTEARIKKNLNALAVGRTCLIIAHRLSTIRHAHKIIVLRDGIVAQCGTHEQLLATRGDYREMWMLQHEKL